MCMHTHMHEHTYTFKNKSNGPGKMAQWVKALGFKPDYLNFDLWDLVVKGEN